MISWCFKNKTILLHPQLTGELIKLFYKLNYANNFTVSTKRKNQNYQEE
ncbi:hypothetical protein CCAND95_190039 [Capnocytophaga canis]|uniref:Uncharacterized protein n=1 Tax=Capnocytophaga canis TaxID=1848903 RepID=A0A0B7IVP3_9FLAO|nr:hypothetical protein CCAND95_190039 [Capnocytophaga canis]CEN54023.1 hypothetical protein CCAND93_680044 [Capnocytophaga canis]